MKRIIEIKALKNGAHRNQTGDFNRIPDGWAVIPDEIETPNFPFGEVEIAEEKITEPRILDDKQIEKVVGVKKVVTKWIAGTMPEVKEVEQPISEMEKLRADIDFVAVMAGVEL